jgi:hypothetical protein
VLDEAGIALPEDDEGDLDLQSESVAGPAAEGEVERFREFLEGISPEDFGTPDPGSS